MVFPAVRSLAALLVSAALLTPSMAQTILELPAAGLPGTDLRQALAVPPGGALQLKGLALDSQSGEVADAQLRRTNVGQAAPLLVVHSGSEVTKTRPAPRAHFTGQLVGNAQSSVFVAVDSDGGMRSIVRRGQDAFVGDMLSPNAAGRASLPDQIPRARRVEPATDAPATPFACGVDGAFIDKHYLPPSAALLNNLRNNHQRAGLLGSTAQGPEALAPIAQRRADIIIETDYELFQRLGSSGAVYAYVTDLLGYASSQYESEIGARLNVTQINVYSSPADPWTGSSTGLLLDELQAYWNAPSRTSQPRHHVHLLSGRDVGGGIAYLNTLDSAYKSYAYGVSGSINGGFSASNPQVIWDAVVVAHEIGHAFGSSHTHSFDNPIIGSSQGGAIDCCYSEDAGQCSTQLGGSPRYGVVPGISSTTGGSAGTGAGTIMSYCHTLSPGMANLSFNFGTNHTRGVNPWRVASVLQSSAQTYLPLDTVSQSPALSVSRQGTGSGTVTSSPAGIDCGSTCSASYSLGTQVTLTAQAASGSNFSGWSGACAGAASSCIVSMDSARSVAASFTAVPVPRLITLSKSGTGTGSVTSSPSGLSCTAGCGNASGSFASNTAVTLVAQAASGSTFAGWSGSCTGTGSCTIAAGTSSASVTASFNSSGVGGNTVTPLLQTNISGATGSVQFFSVAVPAGATNLKIQTSGGTGDADLHVRFGQVPTTSLYDCRPFLTGNNETCDVPSPNAGTYHIMLQGFVAFSGLTLTVSYQTGGSGPLADPVAFVTQQYSDFLGRMPDSTGLNYWVTQLNTGSVTRAQLIESMMYSNEFRGRFGPLVRLYTAYFQRVPDYAGLMYWFNSMYPSSGPATSLAQVSEAFAQSAEFVTTYGPLSNGAFVSRVYQNVLGRSPDNAGYTYWLGQLNAGMTRGQVMTSFSESAENQGATANSLLITMSYVGMLRRSPEAAGYTWWLAEVNAGRSNVRGLITSFLNSAEYAARF